MGRSRLNLTGERVGLLTIVGANGVSGSGHSLWDCICECGQWVILSGTVLNNHKTKSCRKCSQIKDITEQKFGCLTAVERVDSDFNGMSKWLCKCDCGNKTTVTINHLTSGHTKTCGHCPTNIFSKKDSYCEGITADGQNFIFSHDDWSRVTSCNWHIDTKGYVVTQINGKQLKLHRFLMKPKKGIQIDHINRNKADCRRSNLRFALNRENAANKSAFRNNLSTGHKNIYIVGKKYRVIIRKDGIANNFGYFSDLKEAIKIANEKRLALFGEFAFQENY
jgi:hypothetical protein